jgi:hypothetical protein
LFLVLSGAGNGAGSGVAEYGGGDLADRGMFDEFFRAERFGAEFLFGPVYDAYHREGCGAGIEEIIIAGGDGHSQLSTDTDNPLLDRCLTVRVARLTHLLAHGEMEAVDGAVDEAVVVELVFAGYEYVAESFEAGGTAEFFE